MLKDNFPSTPKDSREGEEENFWRVNSGKISWRSWKIRPGLQDLNFFISLLANCFKVGGSLLVLNLLFEVFSLFPMCGNLCNSPVDVCGMI